jgi:hypothetical protein
MCFRLDNIKKLKYILSSSESSTLRLTNRATIEAIGAVDDWNTILQAHKKASVKVVAVKNGGAVSHSSYWSLVFQTWLRNPLSMDNWKNI